MEHPRTTSARDHDDSEMIDAATEGGPSFAGRRGGNLAGDVATADELARVEDPEAHTRVSKQTAIDHDQEERPDRARAPDNS